MTCIVGIEYNNKVYMGGDRCSSNATIKMIYSSPKIFIKDKFLFGFAGSFRFSNILQHNVKFHKQKEKQSDQEYLYTISDVIRETLKDHEIETTEELNSNVALIGYKGKLYELQTDFAIIHNMHNYNAIGTGSEIALGSLFTTDQILKSDPEERINIALKAATTFCVGVSGPFDQLKLK